MTPEEIESSTDIGALYTYLQAVRESDDQKAVRLIEARMRELSGANTRADGRGKRVAMEENAYLRIKARVQQGEGGGA